MKQSGVSKESKMIEFTSCYFLEAFVMLLFYQFLYFLFEIRVVQEGCIGRLSRGKDFPGFEDNGLHIIDPLSFVFCLDVIIGFISFDICVQSGHFALF